MIYGVITAWNTQRGFGLISWEMIAEPVYFEIKDCKSSKLGVNSFVSFEIITIRGRTVAKSIDHLTLPDPG